LRNRKVLSLEWKNDGVMDDNSGEKSEKSGSNSVCMKQAAKLAYRATANFLESLRDAVVESQSSFRDRAFSEFLGLAQNGSTTLCFVVDTTGSMAEEIEAVRQITINITEQATTGLQQRPSDYLLSPFNDPGIAYLTSGDFFNPYVAIVGGG